MDVLPHETGDEVIGVIVARLHPDPQQWIPQTPVAVVALGSSLGQVLGLKLPTQERVGGALGWKKCLF